jgi:putative inorganic carbon (hco3(-)) transporter
LEPDADISKTAQENQRKGFFWVLVYLVFEYLRPQDYFPALGYLHPAWLITPLMMIRWPKGAFSQVRCRQVSVMLVLSVMLLVSIPFVANHYRAYYVATGFVLLLPFTMSIILLVNTIDRVLAFVKCWALLGLYVACGSVLHPGGMNWGSYFLGDRNDVALVLVMLLPLAWCMFAYERTWLRKGPYLVVTLLCVIGIVLTTSRGGFVGLVAVLFVLWLFNRRKILALVLVAILTFAVYEVAPSSYWSHVSTIQATGEGTAKGRLDSWMSAWRMFKDYPLGVGGGQFAIHFPEYQGDAFGSHNMWGREAHSLWFTLLAELGIPGAILFAAHMRANWKSLRHLRRLPPADEARPLPVLLSTAFFASFAGYFAAASFLSALYYPHYWFMSALLVATDRALARKSPDSRPQEVAVRADLHGAGA